MCLLSDGIDQVALAAAVEQAFDSIVITDTSGKIQYVNPAFTAMTGYTSAEAVGQNPRILKSGRQSAAFYKQLWETVASGQHWRGEVIIRRKDGTFYQEEMQITPVRNALGEISSYIAIKHDVTERRAREDEKAFLAAIVENSVDAIVAYSPTGMIKSWNRGAEMLLGFASDEMIGKHAFAFIPPDRQSFMAECIRRVSGGEVLLEHEGVCLRRDGQRVEVSVTGSPIKASDGRVTSIVASMHDISKRRSAEESVLFKTALLEGQMETTLDGILIVDEADRVLLVNRQFGVVFGIPPELLKTGNDLLIRKYAGDTVIDPEAFREKVAYLYAHPEEKGRDEIRFKNGTIYDRYSSPLVDSLGRYRGRIWYFRDITDRKKAEERSQFLAFHDGLTGLPQRALLQDRLETALAAARRRNEKIVLLFLDLDRFKNINDTLGHSFGDDVLKDVERRLRHWARAQDTVARVGGDEFVIMLTGVEDAANAAVAAERIMNAMKGEFWIQGHILNVGCSIGVSMFPEDGTDGESLIRNADAALYSVKESGRGEVRFFTGTMNAQATERLLIEKSLRLALERDEFFLEYQPQVEIASGTITGIEALIRWQQPQLGLVPPSRFISIAENCGLILPIGEWVLRTACAQARKWQDAGSIQVPLAVNVSAVQFRQSGFLSLIRRVLSETGLSPQFLELELTEGVLISEVDVTFSVLRELQAMGVKLAIDDFGTGYSSLSYLKHFPVSKLKIDHSFIRDLATDSDDAAITIAIIHMARSLNLQVIAEGVENETQMSFLRRHRCDGIQGFYLCRPMVAEKLDEWMLHAENCAVVQRKKRGRGCRSKSPAPLLVVA